jgi:hypothetical protein
MTIAIESVNAAVVVVLYCYTISVVSAVFCLIETPYNLIPFYFHFRFSYFRFRLVSVFHLFPVSVSVNGFILFPFFTISVSVNGNYTVIPSFRSTNLFCLLTVPRLLT